MGNSSSTEASRPLQEEYVPAYAKGLRDHALLLFNSDPVRRQLFQKAAKITFEHNNDEFTRNRHEVDLRGLYKDEAVEYAELEIKRAMVQLGSHKLVFIVGRELSPMKISGELEQTISEMFAKFDFDMIERYKRGVPAKYKLSFELGVPN